MSEFKIPFGKYKGKQLSELCEEDGRYVIWLFKQDWVNEKMKSNITNVLDSVKLNFGTHKDKLLGEVKETHDKYYKWLLKCD